MPTLYELLDVSPTAPYDKVRDAYRKKAREAHPDVSPAPDAHVKMAQINVAFEILSDPVRRHEYDLSIGKGTLSERDRAQSRGRPAAVETKLQARLKDHLTPVYTLGFEKATGRLVSSSFSSEVIWWDAKLRIAEQRVHPETTSIGSLAIVGEGAIVAAGGGETSVTGYIHSPEKTHGWRIDPKAWVSSVCVSPNGKYVAYGTTDRRVVTLDAHFGTTVRTSRTHEQAITALAWSPGSNWLASGSADATVKVYEASSGREIATILQVRSDVTAIAFSPDSKWMAVAAVDLSIRIFKTAQFSLAKTFFGHDRPIETLAFHPGNWLLASGSRDGTVRLWNIRQGTGHGRLEASHLPLSCVAFSPDGKHLVSGGLDKTIRVWSLSTPRKGEENSG